MVKYEGNRFALSCCDLIIQGRAPFTALYLYGAASGCGKTAMLNYIESGIFLNNAERTVVRLSANDFTDFGYSSSDNIRSKCNGADVVLLDNLQYIIPHSAAADCLLSVLEHMHHINKKLVFTADCPLEKLGGFLDDTLSHYNLINRLKWEMTAKIASPSKEDCFLALNMTAKEAGLPLNKDLEEAFSVILDAEGNNMGNVLGTLRRIAVRANLSKKKITAKFAENVIYEGVEIELLGA